jgi:hypothetical protein
MDAAGRAQAMDEIIAAQTRFLDGILASTLLGDEKSSKRLYELLGKVADLVLDFHGASTAFLASSHAEVEARVKHQRSIAANTQKGAWGETKDMAEENAKRRAVFVHRTLANAERKFDNQKADFKVCLRSRNPRQVALYKRPPAFRLSVGLNHETKKQKNRALRIQISIFPAQKLTNELVRLLREYAESDLEMQYLAEHIDFNDYFTTNA